jgi:hypothetical protein
MNRRLVDDEIVELLRHLVPRKEPRRARHNRCVALRACIIAAGALKALAGVDRLLVGALLQSPDRYAHAAAGSNHLVEQVVNSLVARRRDRYAPAASHQRRDQSRARERLT